MRFSRKWESTRCATKFTTAKESLLGPTVGATVKEREVYADNLLTNGFSLNTGGGVKVLKDGLNGGVYSFKVTGNEIAENVRLTRTYTLNTGVEYTFKYYFESNVSGKIKIAADGSAFAENI